MAYRTMGFAATTDAELAEPLPGYQYSGNDPDGFMTMPEVVEFISTYATVIQAPVYTGTTVTRVGVTDAGYEVTSNLERGPRRNTVVLVSGAKQHRQRPCDSRTRVPASVASAHGDDVSITSRPR